MKLDVQTVAEIEEGRAQLELALSYSHDAMRRASSKALPPREAMSIELCYSQEAFDDATRHDAALADFKQRVWNLMKASPHFENAVAIFQKFANTVWPRIQVDKAKLPPPAEPELQLTDKDLLFLRKLDAIDRRFRR